MKPEWYKICENPVLHKRFRELARSFTRNPELREDLYQEAWLAVCEYLSGINPAEMIFKGETVAGVDAFLSRDSKGLEYYEKIGYRAMNRLRMREKKYRELFKPWVNSSSYQRVRRKLIKIKRKNEKNV